MPVFGKLLFFVLFCFCIHAYHKLPKEWETSIGPTYKKSGPANYRPIHLLTMTSKSYSWYLLTKLEEWGESNNIIVGEQADFSKGRHSVDQYVLYNLINKYAKGPKKHLYAVFVDLTSAFDRINQERLWIKLWNANTNRGLCILIRILYENKPQCPADRSHPYF